MRDVREEIIRICRLLYERKLTDAAGGNVSVKEKDYIYLTSRFSGSKYQWNIKKEQISVIDKNGKVIEGPEDISRESRIHFGLYREFPNAGAIIHAHPQNILVFATKCRPIPPVLEYTEKFGTIELTEPAKAHSEKLANVVVKKMLKFKKEFEKHAIACLIPYHGIVVMGRDLSEAYDTLERIETNARCILMGRFI